MNTQWNEKIALISYLASWGEIKGTGVFKFIDGSKIIIRETHAKSQKKGSLICGLKQPNL